MNRQLVMRMTRREVIGRYRGSMLGIFWSFISPLTMLAIYTFVFSYVFKARWSVNPDANFSLLLFSGIITHGFLAECLQKAPTLIVNNANYVKKVVFPLEVLAWIAVLCAGFHLLVSAAILLLAQMMLMGHVPATWLYLPILYMPLLFVCLGVSWLLSSLGVFMRDIAQVTGLLSTILMFLCPIFYPIEAIPQSARFLILLNPLSFIVEQVRAVLLFGERPQFVGLTLYTLIALCFAQLCYLWFMKTRRGFADVL